MRRVTEALQETNSAVRKYRDIILEILHEDFLTPHKINEHAMTNIS